MKTRNKVLLLALCALLLVVTTVFATLAYLTSQDTVTNTFTVGKVEITLDEAKVNEYGVEDANADRVDANTYKLIPGHTYVKDPTIHVAAGSEESYLFAKIENGLSTVANINFAQDTQWKQLADEENVWYYDGTATAGNDYEIFESFTVNTNADLTNAASAQIVVTGYAVQKDGFNSAAEAWNGANFQ